MISSLTTTKSVVSPNGIIYGLKLSMHVALLVHHPGVQGITDSSSSLSLQLEFMIVYSKASSLNFRVKSYDNEKPRLVFSRILKSAAPLFLMDTNDKQCSHNYEEEH